MWDNPFELKYDAKGDYYDIVVDKKIQAVVDELKKLPHVVLIRYMTYWMDDVDNGKYEVESDLPHEEWYADCKDYADSTTDEMRYMHAKCMAETLGHMLQDIKYYHPNKYPAAIRTVKSWKKYRFIYFTAKMRDEIDKAWIEPEAWEDGKPVAYAYAPFLAAFMKQVEDGKMEEAAGNAFYLLERLARLYCKDVMLFESDKDNHCSFYEFLLEAVCHILAVVMKDKRTDRDVRSAMTWQLGSINMLYGRIFESSYTSFQDLMNGDADDDTFAWGYEYLVIGPSAFTHD